MLSFHFLPCFAQGGEKQHSNAKRHEASPRFLISLMLFSALTHIPTPKTLMEVGEFACLMLMDGVFGALLLLCFAWTVNVAFHVDLFFFVLLRPPPHLNADVGHLPSLPARNRAAPISSLLVGSSSTFTAIWPQTQSTVEFVFRRRGIGDHHVLAKFRHAFLHDLSLRLILFLLLSLLFFISEFCTSSSLCVLLSRVSRAIDATVGARRVVDRIHSRIWHACCLDGRRVAVFDFTSACSRLLVHTRLSIVDIGPQDAVSLTHRFMISILWCSLRRFLLTLEQAARKTC